MAKFHWCMWCKAFRVAYVAPKGYYKWPRLCCSYCQRIIGSPE